MERIYWLQHLRQFLWRKIWPKSYRKARQKQGKKNIYSWVGSTRLPLETARWVEVWSAAEGEDMRGYSDVCALQVRRTAMEGFGWQRPHAYTHSNFIQRFKNNMLWWEMKMSLSLFIFLRQKQSQDHVLKNQSCGRWSPVWNTASSSPGHKVGIFLLSS